MAVGISIAGSIRAACSVAEDISCDAGGAGQRISELAAGTRIQAGDLAFEVLVDNVTRLAE